MAEPALRVLRTGGLWFDGVSGYVQAPHFYYNSHFTVSVWFKFNYQETPTYRAHTLVDNGFGVYTDWSFTIDRHAALYPDKALIAFETRGGGSIVNYSYWLYAETWYHAAVVTNDGIYVNGVKIASGSINIDSITKGSHPLRIARSTCAPPDYFYFPGIINKVCIYNRSLSIDEVKAIYERDELIKDGLVLCLDFTEGEGNIAYDKSGMGNHATIYGGARWVIKKALRVLPKAG